MVLLPEKVISQYRETELTETHRLTKRHTVKTTSAVTPSHTSEQTRRIQSWFTQILDTGSGAVAALSFVS